MKAIKTILLAIGFLSLFAAGYSFAWSLVEIAHANTFLEGLAATYDECVAILMLAVGFILIGESGR